MTPPPSPQDLQARWRRLRAKVFREESCSEGREPEGRDDEPEQESE